MQAISYVTPLFYANEVIQELIRGGTLLDEWKMLIGLPIYGMVLLALATLTLRELD